MQRLRAPAEHDDPLEGLSDQERRILELIGEGMTNREIGQRLFLSEKTVKNYVSNVLGKLGLHRRTQVAVLATQVRLGTRPVTFGSADGSHVGAASSYEKAHA
jgi:two-component system, NarL family, response regulator DevR